MTPEEAIRDLHRSLRQRRCVFFLGSGISIGSGLPDGAGLLAALGLEGIDLLHATEAVRDTPMLYQDLREIFKDREPNDQHRLLALLRARYYITTNYDTLLESAFRDLYAAGEYERRIRVVTRPDDLAYEYDADSTIIKLHGDIRDQPSLVMSTTDYAERLRNPTLLDSFTAVTLAQHPVLFVGYSTSDIDVVYPLFKETKWTVGAPPARYAILPPADSKRETARLAQLGIRPVILETAGPEGIGDAVGDLLVQLCEEVDDYSFFGRMDEAPPHTPLATWERVWAYYRTGDYELAMEALQMLTELVTDWRPYPTLFGRYAYFSVKIYDKLERWEELLNQHVNALKPHFAQMQRILPSRIWGIFQGRYHAALALVHYRLTAFAAARESIELALAQPPATTDADSQALLADWHVLRSMALLGEWAHGDRLDTELLDDASAELTVAQTLLARYGGLETSDESHYAGRFYGTRALVELARVEHAAGDAQDADAKAYAALLDDAKRAHNQPKRLSYGRLAGLYCEAYARYAIGRSGGGARTELAEALELLRQAERAVEHVPLVVEARFASLRSRCAEALGGTDEERASLAATAAAAWAAIGERHGRELAHRLAEAGDAWLMTPLT